MILILIKARVTEVYVSIRRNEQRRVRAKAWKKGRLAQLVERYPYKVDVTSSSLVMPTIFEYIFVQSWPFRLVAKDITTSW